MFVANDGTGAIWVGDGITRRHVTNEVQYGALIWGAAAGGRPLRDFRTGRVSPGVTEVSIVSLDELGALGKPI
jgi:hypothetical protein